MDWRGAGLHWDALHGLPAARLPALGPRPVAPLGADGSPVALAPARAPVGVRGPPDAAGAPSVARGAGAGVAVAALGAAGLPVAVVPVVVAPHALHAFAVTARGAAVGVAVAEGRAPGVQPGSRGVVPGGVQVEVGFSSGGVNHVGAVGEKPGKVMGLCQHLL